METQSLCRICFEMGCFGLNGYDIQIQGESISIKKMIERFSDIEPLGGNAPEMICEACTNDLAQSYLFTEKIQQADARILSMFSPQINPPVVYEEEIASYENPSEVEIDDNSQVIEEQFTEESQDLVENVYSHIVEEIFEDPESPMENLDLIPTPEPPRLKRKYRRKTPIILTPNFEVTDPEPEEPKPKISYPKREKPNKEIPENSSFVITQFTSASASQTQMENRFPDDNDEVVLSDVRTMNFETVEVKAQNMNIGKYDGVDDQGELPIDDSRIYLCQYCPKAFSSSPFLIAHVRKSHGCTYCAQMFSKSKELHEHIRETHKTFTCVVCTRVFASNSNLRSHLKSVHKIQVPANVAILSYKKKEPSYEVEEEVF